MAIEILAFEGSTLTLLIIAIIAVIALAFFRFLIPLIIATPLGLRRWIQTHNKSLVY